MALPPLPSPNDDLDDALDVLDRIPLDVLIDSRIRKAFDAGDVAGAVEQIREQVTDADVESLRPGPTGRVALWSITDDGSAEWAMRKLAQIESRRAEIDSQAAAWIAEIRDWQTGETRRLDQRAGFFRYHLTEYAGAYRALDPKRNKTLRLPSGKVSSTETSPKAKVADQDAVAAWLRGHLPGDLVDELVSTQVKVAAVPFRRIADVVDVPVAWDARLACGHLVRLTRPAPREWAIISTDDAGVCDRFATENDAVEALADYGAGHDVDRIPDPGPDQYEPVDVGELLDCPECPAADPIDGTVERQPVAGVDVILETRVVVQGVPVDGAVVEPGTLTFTIQPDLADPGSRADG